MSENGFDRRRFLKLIAAAGTAVTVPTILAACGVKETPGGQNIGPSSTQEPSESALESFSLKTAGSQVQAVAVMQYALQLAAKEFTAANVDVEIQDMAQNTAILTMRSGEVDTISMSWLNLAQSKEQGQEALGVAPIWANATSLVSMDKNGWSTVDDILGKRLGVGNRETASFTDMRSYLDRHGIDIENDFSLTSMTDQSVLVALLQSGEFDAIGAFEPLTTKLLGMGGVELINFGLAIGEENDGFLAPSNSWGLSKAVVDKYDPAMLKDLFVRANQIAMNDSLPYELANEIYKMPEEQLELFRSRWSKLLMEDYTDRGLELAQQAMDREFAEGRIGSQYDVLDLIVV